MSRPPARRGAVPELPRLDFPATGFGAADIYRANAALAPALVQNLASRAGAEARAHLLADRSLPSSFVRAQQVGYIPEGRYTLRDMARRLKLPFELMVAGGHCKRSVGMTARAFRDGHQRDPESAAEFEAFFRERCVERAEFYHDYHTIIPILEDGKSEALYGNWLALPVHTLDDDGVVQIGGFQLRSCYPGSVIGKGERYRNPISTAALSWVDTLIGYATEREQIARSGRVVIVEGIFDRYAVMAALDDLPAAERPGVVALGGSAARGAENGAADMLGDAGVLAVLGGATVLLFTDADDTGTKANLDIGPRLAALGCTVRIVRVEDGWEATQGKAPKDPGELLHKAGPAAVQRAVAAAADRGLAEFAVAQIDAALQGRRFRGSLWHRMRVVDPLGPALRALPDPLRSEVVARVAEAVALDPSAIAVLATPHTGGRAGNRRTGRQGTQAKR